MLRLEKEEPIRTYGQYVAKHELGKTRKGRAAPTESYTSYITGLISKVVEMSSKKQQQKPRRF